MAVAFVRNHTAITAIKASGTTIGANISTVVPVGNLLVCRVLFDNAATASKPWVSSIAVPAGETNTWVSLGRSLSTSTTVGAFAAGEIMAIRTSVEWPVAAYTVTLDTATVMKTTLVQEFSGALATVRSTGGTAYSTTTTAASASTTGTAPVIGDLAIGFIFGSNVAAAMAGDNDTTAGAWSAVAGLGSTGGNVATNNFGVAQYKILTAATAQTLNNSAAMTAGNGAIVAILQQYVDPAITLAAYRFYADGTETGSTALAAQDTTPTVDVSAGDVNAQLRVRLEHTSNTLALLDSYPASNRDGLTVLSTPNGRLQVGQSFLGDGKTLGRVGFYLAKNIASPVGVLSATLWTQSGVFGADASAPSVLLATSTTTVNATDLPTQGTSFTWVYFDFASTVQLSSGVPYVVVLQVTGGSGFIVNMGSDTTSSTHPGRLYTLPETTGVWAPQPTTSDLIFEVYTNSAASVDPWDDFQLQWEKNASGTWAAVSAPALLEYTTLNTGSSLSSGTANTGYGQSFLGNGQPLVGAQFSARRDTTVAGDVTAVLYAHTGVYGSSGVGTGSALATSNTIARAALATAYQWETFTFDGTYTLVAGTPYIIVLFHSGAVSGSVFQQMDAAGSHAGNETYYNGSTWTSNSTYDVLFRIDTPPPTAAVTPYGSSNLTDAAATTNRLTGGTGTFTAGKVSEDGLADDLGWSGNNYTELLYSLTFKKADLANADTIRFRVLRNGATTGLTYTQTPTATILKAALTPVASFTATPTTLMTGGTVTFTDTSTNEPTTWAWNFGTGASPATASTKGPHTVTYSTVGTSTATLTASNTAGSDVVDTPTNITITPAPAVTLAAYRFYADGIESYSTPLAAQNVSAPGDVSLGDANLQLRVLLQSTNATAIPATDDWQLQFEKNSSGTWSELAAGEVLADSYPSSYYVSSQASVWAAGQAVGQSFLGNGQSLTRVGFYASNKVGTPTKTLSAALFAHTGTFGTSTGLAVEPALAVSDSVVSATVVPPGMVYFTFPTPVALTNGTPYVIAVQTDAEEPGGTSYLRFGQDTTSLAHPGTRESRSGGVWTATTFTDLVFEVYTAINGSVAPYDSANLTNAAATTRRMGVIDEFDSTAGMTGNAIGTTVTAVGQTFRGSGTPVGAVQFSMTKNAGATGNAVAKIYAHTGTFGSSGAPTGTALATSDAVDVSTWTTTRQWIEFTFSGGNQITLTNGIPYVVLVEYTGAIIIGMVSVAASTDGLHSGNRTSYSGSWVASGSDVLFKIFSTTGTGTGTFVPGKISEDGLVDDLGWTGNNFTEVLYALTLKQADLANSDTLRFRILRNGATSSFTYTQTPTLTVVNVPLAVSQAAYQFYADGPESTSTALALANTAYAADLTAGDLNLHLRSLLQSTSVTSPPATDDWQLQFEKNASGTWVNVEPTEYYEGFDESYGLSGGTATAHLGTSQSFLGNGQKLRRAGFYLSRVGSPAFTITAQLYAHIGTFGTSGSPTGTALAISTNSRPASELLVSPSYGWVDFDFDGTYTLVNGTPYTITTIFSAATDASNYIANRINATTAIYPGNRSLQSSAGVWGSQPNDAIFRVYTDRPSVPGTVVGHYSANVIGGAATTRRVGVIAEYFTTSTVGNQVGLSFPAYGETFIGTGLAITAAQFWAGNATGATGNAVAKIYAHTGAFGTTGLPTGTALATSDSVNVASLATTNRWTDFPFSGGNQITLTNGTPYVVVIEYSGSNNISVSSSSGTGSSAGNSVSYSSSTWTASSADILFKVICGGTGTWTPGKIAEDGLVDDLGFAGNGVTELLYAVTLKQADLTGDNTLKFRILRNGATAGLTYTQYPTITVGAVVVAPPITSFTASVSSVVQGQTVTFTDTSTNTPTTWAWDFGVGASPATASTAGPHTVTYSTVGTSTVTLTAGNAGGSDTVDAPTSITVTAPAVALTRNIRLGNAALQRSFTR